MNTAEKRKAAIAALDNHARRYKVAIPDRLKKFYAGDFDRYHLQFTTAKVSGFGGGTASFQLALTPPSWLNKDDDAINGPGGEWEDAKHHVPLFVTDQALYAVANLKNPACPIGWYHEENWSDGPSKGAPSLDAFLASLKPKAADPDDTFTPADPDQDWEEDFSDDGPRAFVAVDDDD
jgi:hypothetical protein